MQHTICHISPLFRVTRFVRSVYTSFPQSRIIQIRYFTPVPVPKDKVPVSKDKVPKNKAPATKDIKKYKASNSKKSIVTRNNGHWVQLNGFVLIVIVWIVSSTIVDIYKA